MRKENHRGYVLGREVDDRHFSSTAVLLFEMLERGMFAPRKEERQRVRRLKKKKELSRRQRSLDSAMVSKINTTPFLVSGLWGRNEKGNLRS